MSHQKNLRILIAEDNPLEQATLKKMLENLGCLVCAVATGRQAVKEFVSTPFDLVLLDIMMPEMDGFSAARLIRARETSTGSNTPLVALTSCSLQEIESRCHAADMDGYLSKPVEKCKLFSMLKHLGFILPEQNASASAPPPDEYFHPELEDLPVFAPQKILDNLANDFELLRELVDMYLLSFASQPQELSELLYDGELEDIQAQAHGLKGMTANLGGLRLAAIAEQIQQLCRQGLRPEQGRFAAALRHEGQAFLHALEGIDWQELSGSYLKTSSIPGDTPRES